MIHLKVRKLKNSFEKAKGLIGYKEPIGVKFETRYGIHTFGLKFPIDILVLDNSNTVKFLKEELKPNKFYFWDPKYYNVIELPSKTINNHKIHIESEVNLEYM